MDLLKGCGKSVAKSVAKSLAKSLAKSEAKSVAKSVIEFSVLVFGTIWKILGVIWVREGGSGPPLPHPVLYYPSIHICMFVFIGLPIKAS